MSVPDFHFHSGVASTSRSEPPMPTREEIRKPRRRTVIALLPEKSGCPCSLLRTCLGANARYCNRQIPVCGRLSHPSFACHSWECMRHDTNPFFHRDNFVDGHIRQPIDLAAWPCNLQRIDLGPFSQPEVNTRITCRHIAHPALGLLHMNKLAGCQF